jgi:iron complex transport system ATP-binding protein
MIQARNVSYKVGDKYLVQDISLDIESGKLHLLIGPNGAGKSTLVKLLSGQLPPSSGQVLYNNKQVNEYTVAQLARTRSVLSQNLEFSFPMKVWEVVMMGRYPHFTGSPKEKDITACQAAIDHFNIAAFADRDYTTLSGGEKQRVHFARVMAQIWYPAENGHRYLLLDEPLTFLDVHYQHQFMEQIKDLLQAPDIVVIGVVHDLNLASKFADRITLLHNGSILATGNATEVLTKENIEMAYQVVPEMVSFGDKTYLIF